MARLTGGRAAGDAEWQVFAAKGPSDLAYAVTSTGIHCRAGCPARVCLHENLRIFDSRAAAEATGFRACKRCGGAKDGPPLALPGP